MVLVIYCLLIFYLTEKSSLSAVDSLGDCQVRDQAVPDEFC